MHADHRWFATTDARYDEFLRLRDSPLLSASKALRLESLQDAADRLGVIVISDCRLTGYRLGRRILPV